MPLLECHIVANVNSPWCIVSHRVLRVRSHPEERQPSSTASRFSYVGPTFHTAQRKPSPNCPSDFLNTLGVGLTDGRQISSPSPLLKTLDYRSWPICGLQKMAQIPHLERRFERTLHPYWIVPRSSLDLQERQWCPKTLYAQALVSMVLSLERDKPD